MSTVWVENVQGRPSADHTGWPGQPLRLGSAFQPILSLSHGRVVGWEALLRAERMADGRPLPPAELFASLRTPAQRADLDLRGLQAHLQHFAQTPAAAPGQWLFLNLDPASLQRGVAPILKAIAASALPPERLVIEVLESPMGLDGAVREGVQALREAGCLIALDDFGAGHSNFERVFELRPHIVKLDRHVLLRAKQGRGPMRIVAQMVALLHECGALVLMEGIETLQGAHVALGCDVDLVQGYFFGRPEAAAAPGSAPLARLAEAWRSFDPGLVQEPADISRRLAPHSEALSQACADLGQGVMLGPACVPFLALDDASLCYLLDDQGLQVGEAVFRPGHSMHSMGSAPQFAPLFDCSRANWSRRAYFRRALRQPGVVQVTRPYLTLQGGRMCRTLSLAFQQGDRLQVLCADLEVAPG